MPPASSDLQWVEIKQFKGLWTRGSKFFAPPEYSQIMSGCQPQPKGGLRAFFAPIYGAKTHVGFQAGLSHRIRAFGIIPDTVTTGNVVAGNRYILLTSSTASGGNLEIWRRSDTDTLLNDVNMWVNEIDGVLFDGSGVVSGTPLVIPTFVRHGVGSGLHGGISHYYLEQPFSTDGNIGVFEVAGSPLGNSLSRINVQFEGAGNGHKWHGPLATHQSRLLVAVESSILATDPGAAVLDPAPVVITLGNEGTNSATPNARRSKIHWVLSVPPDDLLVGHSEGTIYNIQGDISDPSIVDLGNWGRTVPHTPLMTPHGPAVIFARLGPQILSTGGQLTDISEALDNEVWDVEGVSNDAASIRYVGNMAFSQHLLYCPNLHDVAQGGVTTLNNGALIYDFITRAWFTSVHPDVQQMRNPRFITQSSGRYNPGVFVATGAAVTVNTEVLVARYPGATVGADGVGYDPTIARAKTWEMRSVPLRTPTIRRTEVQEVQLGVFGFGASCSMTITLYNEKGVLQQTRTVTVPDGASLLRIPVAVSGQYVEIGLKAVNSGTGEAPMLEFLRLGYRPDGRSQYV